MIIVYPGPPSICALRLSGFSAVLALDIFFGFIRKRGKTLQIPVYLFAAVAILICETLLLVCGRRDSTHHGWYAAIDVLVWCISYVFLYLKTAWGHNLKSAVSLQKMLEGLQASVVLTVLSGTTIWLAVAYPNAVAIFYLLMLVLWGMHMWYLFSCMPEFVEAKPSESGCGARKKGYSADKSCKKGQMLEDEGGGDIADEGIVEDSRIIYSLMTLFEKEKLYMNMDIKIANVALMIGTNKTYLSRALNTRLSKNFCQFVNHYRIREVCSLFIDNPELEIRELAEQCGFNSSSNFSIVFKYNTGFTPIDWCRMIKQKLDNDETVFVDDYLI